MAGARAKTARLSSRPSVWQTFMLLVPLHFAIHSFCIAMSFSASSSDALKSTASPMVLVRFHAWAEDSSLPAELRIPLKTPMHHSLFSNSLGQVLSSTASEYLARAIVLCCSNVPEPQSPSCIWRINQVSRGR